MRALLAALLLITVAPPAGRVDAGRRFAIGRRYHENVEKIDYSVRLEQAAGTRPRDALALSQV
jgi:hypothetical protein